MDLLQLAGKLVETWPSGAEWLIQHPETGEMIFGGGSFNSDGEHNFFSDEIAEDAAFFDVTESEWLVVRRRINELKAIKALTQDHDDSESFNLREWHERRGYTYNTGAQALGMSRTPYAQYLKKDSYPKWLILACKAIDRGIKE